MATFTMNMSGLPAIDAVNDSYSFPTTHTINLALSVLDNDSLGFGTIEIINVTDVNTVANVGALTISDDGLYVNIALNSPGSITPGVYTFTYTIEDSFERTDTATVTITIIA